MKTFIRLFSVLLSIMLFCTGCGVSKENSKSDTVENKEPTVDEKVEKIVNNMTLEEKVGQIFMVAPEAVDKDGGITTVFTENINLSNEFKEKWKNKLSEDDKFMRKEIYG